ncbi:hypothetical protein AKO1_012594, partial [Acrasis kona]
RTPTRRNYTHLKGVEFYNALLAGAGAGFSSRSVAHPFDTCKVLLQIRKGEGKRFYQSMQYLGGVLKQEGALKTLFRGYPTSIMMAIPASTIYLTTYQSVKTEYLNMGIHKDVSYVLAGITAELAGSILTPMYIVIQRRQAYGSKESTSIFTTLKQMYNQNGIRGLYSGYLAGLSTSAPFSAVFFSTYEFVKKRLVDTFESNNPEAIDHPPFYIGIGCGAISGMVAAAVTNPLDVVKTRLQIQGKATSSEHHYRGIFHAFSSIIRNEGLKSLLKGVGPRTVSVIPATAISMGAFEGITNWLRSRQ